MDFADSRPGGADGSQLLSVFGQIIVQESLDMVEPCHDQVPFLLVEVTEERILAILFELR
ncbi:hypothetical protein [Methylotetracoccus oryzae]|uniref:hypothetical protein n=1 Tax=Methylotetracoccus oryzae TaxID=1919059 RepID=UPI00111AC971|nr:hypothetical protein [Methylotetracoccus oryzae]